jgi:hypothetical protein
LTADDPLTDDDFDEDSKSLPLRSCYGSIGELSSGTAGGKKHDKKKHHHQQQQTPEQAALVNNTAAINSNPSTATIKSIDNVSGSDNLKRSTSMNVTRADRGSKSSSSSTHTVTNAAANPVRHSKTSMEVDELGYRLVLAFFFYSVYDWRGGKFYANF